MSRRKLTLAEKHLGIITERAVHYHRFLPPREQAVYDVDDMIQDVLLYTLQRARTYDPERGAESTWVYQTAAGRCITELARRTALQRGVSVTGEMTPEIEKRAGTSPWRDVEAQDAVEHVIRYCSDAARDLLSRIFSGRARGLLDSGGDFNASIEAAVEDLKRAAREHGARLSDFERVYRASV